MGWVWHCTACDSELDSPSDDEMLEHFLDEHRDRMEQFIDDYDGPPRPFS